MSLFADNLRKIYFSEQTQQLALAGIMQKSNSGILCDTITAYKKTKQINIARLKKCFDLINTTALGNRSELAEMLVDNCLVSVKYQSEKYLSDIALICKFQQVVHYNIANYRTLVSYAKSMEEYEMAQLLLNALKDEKAIDEQLSEITEETATMMHY